MKEVINEIIRREGGYTIDHAGPTKYGIIIPTLSDFRKRKVTKQDIINLTEKEAFKVYEWLFKKYRIDGIEFQPLQDLLFDCCVNHGGKRSARWVQKAAGVKTDGIIGPITLKAINSNAKSIYYNVASYRVYFYARLVNKNNNKYGKFLVGWMNRAREFIKEV